MNELKIKQAEIVLIPIEKIVPHPDNRPLGHNLDKIEQLKILIGNDGFDSSHPLVVRPLENEEYQIIEGEHRFKASVEMGYTELPCVIRDLDDTEALIQLILGNTQSETRPIEIGLNALKVVQKDSKKGYSAAAYAHRLGMAETTVRRYLNAAEVFQHLKEQKEEQGKILDEVYKLEEIHRTPEEDWVWFHDLVQEKELSKNQVIEISQAIREIKTDSIVVSELFDLQAIKKQVAIDTLKGSDIGDMYVDLLNTVKTSYDNLDDHITLYEYNTLQDTIDEEEINLKDWFVSTLKELKNLDKQTVLESYKDALQLKRSSTKEEAERTAEYFRDKKNAEERREQERVEREMRHVKLGEWWQLGRHLLYCGDASSPVFQNKISSSVAFAFANPPYRTELEDDSQENYEWTLDWLAEKAKVVAVTPALHEIQPFMKVVKMPYRWSMATFVTSKEAKGNIDFSTWIYTALFAKDKNATRKVKDSWRIEVRTGHKDMVVAEHKGSKPYDFMEYLIANFSREHETIVDVFAGAGTSFIVAEDTQRICIGAEMNPTYCKEIIEMWEKATQEVAIRIEKA
ncbi:MAG: hypothetical protein EAZ55_13830 [Cytophagales bacterium]|nr:MAG: hypothetical protein EAZ55_13830 [Cytophagales bacterium]